MANPQNPMSKPISTNEPQISGVPVLSYDQVLDFIDLSVDRASKHGYKTCNISALRLQRSVIPEGIASRVPLVIDQQSHLLFSTTAMQLGLTTDELLRRLIWSLNSLSS